MSKYRLVLLLALSLLAVPAMAEEPVEVSPAKVEIRNARTPAPGLLTGGQPTPEQFDEIAQAGYRTVINLRGEGEEGRWDEASRAEELGIEYIELPIAGRGDVTRENALALGELLIDEGRKPAVVHCASGNRVGALFALYAFYGKGDSPEAALEVGKAAGLTSLEETVRGMLQEAAAQQ
jgi:uncharacterized protein (TIGR01244 family)